MKFEQKNINLTEGEIRDLLRALDNLISEENDQIDYTELINKLYSWYN